jgi:hypothetical protein
MKKFIITEDERSRILGMHESATSRHYLNEQVTGETEDLWIRLVNKLGKDKFTINGSHATLVLPDKSILGIGQPYEDNSFGIDIKLPKGITESELTKELLKFGNGGWSTRVGSYTWSDLKDIYLEEVYQIIRKYIK